MEVTPAEAGKHVECEMWLGQFFAVRGLNAPTGDPLFSYHTSFDEYEALRKALLNCKRKAFYPGHFSSWAACFCLFVSEKYRREYDASEGGWSWQGFDNALEIELKPSEHEDLVEWGLRRYWNRPIRHRANGRDFLGSLFLEGGLPWKLVHSEGHSFGRAVRGGLRQYYKAKSVGRPIAEFISEYEEYFPKAFRGPETRLLIGGIVEQLMYLAETFSLSVVPDPAAYLDSHSPGWRKAFPIPLEEENGRALVNEWLKDADLRRKERAKAEEQARAFTCIHYLTGDLEHWSLTTEVFLPKTIVFAIESARIQSTRFELIFYEGDKRLVNGGITYGEIISDENVQVRMPRQLYRIARENVDAPLKLKLLTNGQHIHSFVFEGSGLEIGFLPLVFQANGDNWEFLSNTSCRVASESARIRIPDGAKVTSGEIGEILASDSRGGRWLEVQSDVVLSTDGELVSIEFGTDGVGGKENISLGGAIVSYETSPSITYLGWPSLSISPSLKRDVSVYCDGEHLLADEKRNHYGCVSYVIKDGEGHTRFRRMFGVLPRDFRVSLYPRENGVARLFVRTNEAVSVSVEHQELSVVSVDVNEGWVFDLHPRNLGAKMPDAMELAVRSNPDVAPIRVRLPYPVHAAELLDSEGNEVEGNYVELEQLLGMRLRLASRGKGNTLYRISIELRGARTLRLSRTYPVLVQSVPEFVSLSSFYEDIIQLLSVSPDQDAFVRLCVETDRVLKQYDVHRYHAYVKWESRDIFEIRSLAHDGVISDAKPFAMDIADPASAGLSITERTSQGVGLGVFEIPTKAARDGPWLVYPKSGTDCLFRPGIVPVANDVELSIDESPRSLHEAVKSFRKNNVVIGIEEQINAMAEDLHHSGWQYLEELKKNYSHLPLPAFESWKVLARQKHALALALFRMEIDYSFCSRIANELAIVWESVPFDLWSKAIERFTKYLDSSGVHSAITNSIIEDRLSLLNRVFPQFENIYKRLGGAAWPTGVVEIWYEDMRRQQSGSQWPEHLSAQLCHWTNQQVLPLDISRVADVRFTRAVTYLPVFMAHVAAGRAALVDLKCPEAERIFGIRVLSDFSRERWYEPVFALVLANLLQNQDTGMTKP